MNYDLQQLGSTGFQDLAAVLAVASFGPGVQVMGAGRDGGRDAIANHDLRWKDAHGQVEEVWSGYSVLQAKYLDRLHSDQRENASWLWGRIRDELDAWSDPNSGRYPVPNGMVFITNVPLTPFPHVGVWTAF